MNRTWMFTLGRHMQLNIMTTYILLRLEHDLSLTPLTWHQPKSSYRTAFMSSTWMFTGYEPKLVFDKA